MGRYIVRVDALNIETAAAIDRGDNVSDDAILSEMVEVSRHAVLADAIRVAKREARHPNAVFAVVLDSARRSTITPDFIIVHVSQGGTN